jgi:hypothetical protein
MSLIECFSQMLYVMIDTLMLISALFSSIATLIIAENCVLANWWSNSMPDTNYFLNS